MIGGKSQEVLDNEEVVFEQIVRFQFGQGNPTGMITSFHRFQLGQLLVWAQSEIKGLCQRAASPAAMGLIEQALPA